MKLLLSNIFIVHVTNNYKLTYDDKTKIVKVVNIITDRVYVVAKIRHNRFYTVIEEVSNSHHAEFIDLRRYIEYVTVYN